LTIIEIITGFSSSIFQKAGMMEEWNIGKLGKTVLAL
jgi:hypothetical protein